jgi:insertion element IS1 protein InsB
MVQLVTVNINVNVAVDNLFLNPKNNLFSTKAVVDRLLLERIPLSGIARSAKVSERWLQDYVNEKYANIPRKIVVSKKVKDVSQLNVMSYGHLLESQKQWIWLALDRKTREIVGVFLGDRSRQSAQKLWDSLPGVYRQCAVSYTDFWEAYETVFPSIRHRAVGFDPGQTNHIERFNCTLRQRVSRLVRKTLSFSKKLSNHIGAVWYFIHDYNASLAT